MKDYIELGNIFYFRHINKIGGIETFFYNMARKYNDIDITIIYNTGDIDQLSRLRKYVRCIRFYNGLKIKCEKAFFNFNLDIIDSIEAKEYIQIAHGDYKAMDIKPNISEKINTYYGVSKQVCSTYEEITGKKTTLAYNPLYVEKPKKILNLISATRLTKEKGKERIEKLAKMLDEKKIPFLWVIFTDDTKEIDNKSIVYMKPRLDISSYIANADYLVQLSDNEGYCYSVAESLILKTPVIVTDIPVLKEIGVKDCLNGFILDFDLSNLDINKIVKGVPEFEYTPKEDNWDKLLAPIKSKYKEELKMKVKVRALPKFEGIIDAERNIQPKAGDEWVTSRQRAEFLKENNVVEIIEEVKEIKEEAKEEVKEEKPKKTTKKKTTKK